MATTLRRVGQGTLLLVLVAALPAVAGDALAGAVGDPGLLLLGLWSAAVLLPGGAALLVAYAAGATADAPVQGLLEGLAAGAGGTGLGAVVASTVLFVVLRADDVPTEVTGAVDGALPTLLVAGAVAGLVAAWAGAGFPRSAALTGDRT